MQLPGGLIEMGVRRRDFAFRPLSGALELALAEIVKYDEGDETDESGAATPRGGAALSTPQAVTRALALALERLAGDAASTARVARLCVADRQFLMRALEVHLGHSGGWFDAQCARCGARFDFHLDFAQLPVVEAGAAFPYATLEIDGRARRYRLPTGADQEALVAQPEATARAWLIRALADDVSGDAPAIEPDAQAIAALDAALEAVAPAVVLAVEAACPECGQANTVDLDPYRALALSSDEILREVHEIATHYHWGEAEILGLPRRRRLHYLQLIANARGLTS